MVNLSHAIQMDTAHTASISLQKNDFDIDQAVAVISLINQVTSVEALTVFNSLTKILPVDDALNTVNKMKNTYLSKKMNILVRRSRLSGVARATCPDRGEPLFEL